MGTFIKSIMETEFAYLTSLSIRFDLSDSEILRTLYQDTSMFNWILQMYDSVVMDCK